jgi:hypothetical protein
MLFMDRVIEKVPHHVANIHPWVLALQQYYDNQKQNEQCCNQMPNVIEVPCCISCSLSITIPLKDDVQPWIEKVTAAGVLGSGHTFKKGIWQAVERYRLTMHCQDGGDLPTFEDAHSEMSRQSHNNHKTAIPCNIRLVAICLTLPTHTLKWVIRAHLLLSRRLTSQLKNS